jgi:transposase
MQFWTEHLADSQFVALRVSQPPQCRLMHPGTQIELVYLGRKLVDFRKSIDGLSKLVERELLLTPFAGALYIFVNHKELVIHWATLTCRSGGLEC